MLFAGGCKREDSRRRSRQVEVPVMIVVCAQWQSEIMTVLQGDFEEELRRMSVDRPLLLP
jgi:hypothetical protein